MPDYLQQNNIPAVTQYYNAQAIGLLGLVTWELIVTAPFEWRYLTRRFKPHWSIGFYTTSRLSLFLHLLAIVFNVFGREAIPCNVQAWLLKITTSLVIWFCGAALSLRVLALWTKLERISGVLGILLAGLLVINCLTWQTPDNVWDPALARCVPRGQVHKALILVQFCYTLAFYLAVAAIYTRRSLPHPTLPKLCRLVLHDGLGIFLIVSITFLAQAVLACTWMDDIIIVIFLPPALTIATIAVTRSYIRERVKIEKPIQIKPRKIPISRPTSTWTQPSHPTPSSV